MSRSPHEPPTEPSFGPTSGVITGWLGEALVLAVLVMAVVEQRSADGVRVGLAALLAGVLVWAFLLRSRVVLRHTGVLLRNAFRDTLVPYGSIDRIAVRTVTAVFVGDRKYVGAGVGRTVRAMVRGAPSARSTTKLRTHLSNAEVPDFLEERVVERVKQAREAGDPSAPVRRTWAWPEVGATVVLAAALVVSLLV